MATVGDRLTSPETGWTRYDNTSTYFTYVGNWTTSSSDGVNFGGTLHYTDDPNATITFKFVGSKFRIIGCKWDNRSATIPIVIDGVSETYSAYGTENIRQVLLYEKTLPFGEHTVQISGTSTGRMDMDAIDIEGNGYLLVSIGKQLTAPEPGWKRYDNKSPQIMRNGPSAGHSENTTVSGQYNGSSYWIQTGYPESTWKFNFKGTKIRIISLVASSGGDAKITIDGVHEVYSNYDPNIRSQCLVYEKVGLPDTIHTIEIGTNTAESGKYIWLDAIDIDDNGRLLHPDEVTEISELRVGKKIRCHYATPSANAIGSFMNLGKETLDFIPPTSTTKPLGDFYFNCVEDKSGKLKLIADRNIQNGISWNNINATGIASGSGLPLNKQGITFAGTDSSFLDFGVNPKYWITGDISVTFRFNLTKFGSDNSYLCSCLSVGESQTTNALYSIGITTTGNIVIVWEYGAGSNTILTSTGSYVSLGKEHTLTIVRDSINKILYLYVDGGLKESFPYTQNPTMAATGNTQKLVFGRDNGAYNGGNFAGSIYHASIFNRMITDEERVAVENNEMTSIENGPVLHFDATLLHSNLYSFTIRLLTGGVNANDVDNEWHKYIIEGTGNGAYTAGDNAVWNWSGCASWTSTVNTSGPANRTVIGNTAVNNKGWNASSYSTAVGSGFRPVLIIETGDIVRHLFQDGNDIKTYKNNSWQTIGQAPATEEMFMQQGMQNVDMIRKDELSQLQSPELITWVNKQADVWKTSRMFIVPNPQLVKMNQDISFRNVSDIDEISVIGNVGGNGKVRVLVSPDEGQTWYGYRQGVDIIQPMSDYVSPQGRASANHEYLYWAYSYRAWMAFDGNPSTKWQNGYNESDPPFYQLYFEFNEPTVVNKFRIKTTAVVFEFRGTMDGTTWVTLGSWNMTGKTRNIFETYGFENDVAYKKYCFATKPDDKAVFELQFQNVGLDNWEPIDISNPDEIMAKGIPLEDMLLVSSHDFKMLMRSGNREKLRFAYYLDISNSDDIAELDKISTQLDFGGYWEMAAPGKDYEYTYTDRKTLKFVVKTSGDYKFNY